MNMIKRALHWAKEKYEQVKSVVVPVVKPIAFAAGLALGLGGLVSSAHATTTVDVSGITTTLTGVGTDIVAGAATVATAALGLGAVYFAGRTLWRFFKSLAR
jgi:site-specific recombinase